MSSVNRAIIRKRVLVGLTGMILLPYTFLNGVGLLVLMNTIKGLSEVAVFVAPVLSLPLYFIFLWSPSKASVAIWLNFLILHLGYLLIDWPHWLTIITALRLDWPLLLSAVLLRLAAVQERRGNRILSTGMGV